MDEPGEVAAFHDRCSELMRELLEALAERPGEARPFPLVEDEMGWPRRRIASVLGGVFRLRTIEFGGRRPYRLADASTSASGRWEIWMDARQAAAIRAAARASEDGAQQQRQERDGDERAADDEQPPECRRLRAKRVAQAAEHRG